MSSKFSSVSNKVSGFGTRMWAGILVTSLLVLGANVVAQSYLSGRENNARAVSAELQVLSQKLAKYSQEAVGGKAESFDAFQVAKARIDTIVKSLNDGGNGVDA